MTNLGLSAVRYLKIVRWARRRYNAEICVVLGKPRTRYEKIAVLAWDRYMTPHTN